MTKQTSRSQDDALENEEWDFSTAERRPPVRGRRVIVSVAFSPTDFELVAQTARGNDQKTSEYIREAAIARASGKDAHVSPVVTGSTNSLAFFVGEIAPVTRLAAQLLNTRIEAPLAQGETS